MTDARTRVASSAVRLAILTVLVLGASARSTAAMCVDVSMHFRGGNPTPALVASLKEEAAAIWAWYGVQIEWLTMNGAGGCAPSHVRLNVLVDRRHSPTSEMVLGSTRVGPVPLRYAPIRVDYAATDRLLGSLGVEQFFRLVGRPGATSTDLGRALGRVLAHEIGHVILATATHQEGGLMRRRFLAQDLLRPERGAYLLSTTEVLRLRRHEQALGAQ